MASEEPDAAPSNDLCPWALYCSSCDVWINGSEQFLEHRAGKKHRRKLHAQWQHRPTSDQLYWARFAAQ
eukprot:1086142-Lingulodinium_polyedra.AAC.1